MGSVYKWFTDPANKESRKNKNFFTSIGDWFQDPGNQKLLHRQILKDNLESNFRYWWSNSFMEFWY